MRKYYTERRAVVAYVGLKQSEINEVMRRCQSEQNRHASTQTKELPMNPKTKVARYRKLLRLAKQELHRTAAPNSSDTGKFDRKLEELLDREQYIMAIPGMHEVLAEELNGQVWDVLHWEDLPEEEFDYVLEEEVKGMSGAQLLATPGVYEVAAEYYNNQILEELEADYDKEVNSLSLGAGVKTADNFQRDDFNEFFSAYLETALWASYDVSYESGSVPLGDNYSTGDIVEECVATMRQDCQKFFDQNYDVVEAAEFSYGPDYGRWGRVGHDFWLTRNRCGAGFLDGDYSDDAGEILTEASRQFGETDLYVGNDNVIYC